MSGNTETNIINIIYIYNNPSEFGMLIKTGPMLQYIALFISTGRLCILKIYVVADTLHRQIHKRCTDNTS